MEVQQKLPVYRILVIGANGGTGKQCVAIALDAGHHVTAMLRNPDKLNLRHPNLEIVKGDLMQPDTIMRYLENKDVVISAIGVSGGLFSDKPTTLYSQGNKNLLNEMQKTGVQRAFFISASAIEISPVLPLMVRLAEKYVLQKLLKHMYADITEMENIVKQSGIDWTIMRPPKLTDKPVTGRCRFAINNFLKNCLSISRADLAYFMINNITNEATYKATIEIGY